MRILYKVSGQGLTVAVTILDAVHRSRYNTDKSLCVVVYDMIRAFDSMQHSYLMEGNQLVENLRGLYERNSSQPSGNI